MATSNAVAALAQMIAAACRIRPYTEPEKDAGEIQKEHRVGKISPALPADLQDLRNEGAGGAHSGSASDGCQESHLPSPALNHAENDFAARVAGRIRLLSGAGLGERENLLDDHFQFSGVH